jgi:hypothetical protein
MTLPRLAIAKYPITIPSTKTETYFRPFLVKEQKILMMASESGDEKQIAKAIGDIVDRCVDGLNNAHSMPMFDMEYLFLNIRAKSAGEVVSLNAPCPKCSKTHSVDVKLEEIEVDFKDNRSNKIMLTDKMGIVIRYPCLGDSAVSMNGMNAEDVIEFVAASIESVFDEEMVYGRKDSTQKEMVEFVESMTTEQFEKVTEFYQNLPQVRKEVDCRCPSCGNEYKIDFRGLRDFFT